MTHKIVKPEYKQQINYVRTNTRIPVQTVTYSCLWAWIYTRISSCSIRKASWQILLGYFWIGMI